jgi:recombination protein RecT
MKIMNNQMTVAEAIEETAERFNSVAPCYMQYDAEKGFAVQLLNNNSYLKKAATESPKSLQQAITNVAAIGLSLNPAEKLAYLLPRNVKIGKDQSGRDLWQTRIFLEPSYMGLIRLATNSGSIEWVQADVAYQNDEFIDNGPGEKPAHKYNAFTKDRGELVGVYCVAKTCGGDYLTTTMPLDEIISIRDRSETWKKYNSGPWKDDFNEMAKKAVIRRAFKTWPMTDERAAHAVDLSNINEGFEPILTSPDIGSYTAEQKAYYDQLIESGSGLGMFVFQQTLNNESLFTSLYHSFEKGTKGKYQRIVDELIKAGADQATSILVDLEASLQSNDDVAASEIWDDLSEDEQAYLIVHLSIETQAFVKQGVSND